MGFRCFRGDSGGVAGVFRGGGRLRRGEKGDEGEEADSLRKAAKRWERSNLQILKLPILPLVFHMRSANAGLCGLADSICAAGQFLRYCED